MLSFQVDITNIRNFQLKQHGNCISFNPSLDFFIFGSNPLQRTETVLNSDETHSLVYNLPTNTLIISSGYQTIKIDKLPYSTLYDAIESFRKNLLAPNPKSILIESFPYCCDVWKSIVICLYTKNTDKVIYCDHLIQIESLNGFYRIKTRNTSYSLSFDDILLGKIKI